jgi:hypothetical protein
MAVEDSDDQVTYGITVDGTHTHVTNGIVTHNTAHLTATNIAVIYGLPPDKIGGTTGDSLTYATVEMNTIDYLTFSARPWIVKWEQALNQLFPGPQYVKFETSEMLRTDVKTRAEVDRISLGPTMPWKTQDEVRGARDLGPMSKTDPQSAWQIAKAAQQAQITKSQPPTNGQQLSNDQTNGAETKSISGESAVEYLRSRQSISGPSAVVRLQSKVPQSQSDPSPILKPPPAANGTKPLAVGSN